MSKIKYKSPTTPDLLVTFECYLVEVICLNMESGLSARFWNDDKYWGKKLVREIAGVSKLKKCFDKIDPMLQNVIIESLKIHRVKSLCSNSTREKIVRYIKKAYKEKKESIASSLDKTTKLEKLSRDNNFLHSNSPKNRLDRIKEIENG